MRVAVLDALDEHLAEQVRVLIVAVEVRDGAPPLSEQALLQLAASRPGLTHLVAGADADADALDDPPRPAGDAQPDGYARLDGYAQVDGDVAEIADGGGASAVLLADIERLVAHPTVWSHGRRSPVAGAATTRGYVQTRVLNQLRRRLTDQPGTLPELAKTPELAKAPEPELAEVPLPAGVRLRAFVPGQDEDAWLAVNAAAFAEHAEQGRWTRADLAAREREPWFDPAGFLLAVRDDTLLGFHWTKLHPAGMGEVYVLAVAPAAQGLRLGSALLNAGLAHLAERGATDVLLYVDDSNAAAMRMYRRHGFALFDVDMQYRRA